MDATDVPLQLIECIESMKNDVKRKIGTRRHLRAMYVEEDAAREAMMLPAIALEAPRWVRKGEERWLRASRAWCRFDAMWENADTTETRRANARASAALHKKLESTEPFRESSRKSR